MRTTLARQLRRFDSFGSIADVIVNDMSNSTDKIGDKKAYIIAYHRAIRRAKLSPETPTKKHRRSKNRR